MLLGAHRQARHSRSAPEVLRDRGNIYCFSVATFLSGMLLQDVTVACSGTVLSPFQQFPKQYRAMTHIQQTKVDLVRSRTCLSQSLCTEEEKWARKSHP